MANSEFFEQSVLPTYLENWPVEVRALSMHQEGVELSVEDTIAFGLNQVELFEFWTSHGQGGDGPPDISHIRAAVDEAVRRVIAQGKAPGAFIRLGSRSPKDSWWPWHQEERDGMEFPWPITNGDDAMALLLGTSERVNDDLLANVAANRSSWIFARAWEQIEPWQEFRCFIKDKRVIGISQYDYMNGKVYPQLLSDKSLYINALQLFVNKRVIPALHMDSAVVDMYVKVTYMPSGRGRKASARLLEINPYFELTDPCLFSWKELDKLGETVQPTLVKIRQEA